MPDSPYVANPSIAGQELAHVLPSSQVDPLSLVTYYQQKKDADKLQAVKDAKEKQAHMEAMQKYFGGLLNPKDYETQTDLDTKINQMGVQGNQDLVKAIGDSKGEMSWADVNMLAQQKLKPILDLYQKGTSGKAYIDSLAASHAMDKDIDLGKLKAAAMHNMLYQRDPNTGQWSLNPNGIDGSKDYVTEEYLAHPEWYTKGGGDININGILKNAVAHNIEGTTKLPIDKKHFEQLGYKATLYDHEELKKDKDGNVIGYQTIAKPNALSNGMVMPGVSDNTYAQFSQDMSDVGKLRLATQAYMNRDPDKIFHDKEGNMVQIDPMSDDFKTIEKKVLYDKLNDLSAKKWSTSKIISNAPQVHVRVNNAAKDVPVIDVYNPIKAMAEANSNRYLIRKSDGEKAYGAVQTNLLTPEQQDVVLKQARIADTATGEIKEGKYKGEHKGIQDISDIYLQKDGDDVYIIRTIDDTPLTKLSPLGTNIMANQALGVKSKQKAVIDAQITPVSKKKTITGF